MFTCIFNQDHTTLLCKVGVLLLNSINFPKPQELIVPGQN